MHRISAQDPNAAFKALESPRAARNNVAATRSYHAVLAAQVLARIGGGWLADGRRYGMQMAFGVTDHAFDRSRRLRDVNGHGAHRR